MDYQKVINLLDNIPNQPSKLRTKTWVKINNDLRGADNTNSQIKFKTVKRTITIAGGEADQAVSQTDKRDKEVILKNCVPFTDCISEINNTQVNNAKDLNVVMPMFN